MEMNFFGSKRSIVCALSLVALLSVALGRTVPDSSMKTTPESLVVFVDQPVKKSPESLVEFVDQPVTKSDAISENLFAPWNKTTIVDYCKVDVGSFGWDDSRKCGYIRTSGGSSEDIRKPNELNRGFILFELDPITCTTITGPQFDTWGSQNDRVRLVETMDAAPRGTILIGVTADSAETYYFELRNSVNWFFTKYHMNLIEVGLRYRDKFVFMMQNGYPNKTIYHRASQGGNCLERSFALKVTRVTDVDIV